MGLVKKLLAGLAAVLGFLALWFRSQRDRVRAKRADDHADRQEAAVEQKDKAQDALDETREQQAEEREAPDTEKRDDFEEGWK